MSVYIKGLVTASVIAGIIMALAPESKDGGLKKYIKYITSLLLLIALISPLVPIFTDIESFSEKILEETKNLTQSQASEYESDISRSNELILNKSIENIKDGIAGVIEQKFGVPKNSVEVDLECDTSDISNIIINKITIEIAGQSVSQMRAFLIEEYIKEYFSCDCTVVSDI